MKRTLSAALVGGLVLLACPAFAGAQPGPTIEEYIRRLGSGDFAVRESATKELSERSEARPALEKALSSQDKEVSRRARIILDELDRRRRESLFAAVRKSAESCEFDRLVDALTCHLDQPEDPRCWEVVVNAVERQVNLERKKYGTIPAPAKPGVRSIGISNEDANAALNLAASSPCSVLPTKRSENS